MTEPGRFTCEDVFRRLDDFLDRELASDELAMVQAHLDTCEQCAREHRFESRVIDSIRAKLSHLKAPETLVGRVSRLLEEERRRSG